MKKILLLLVSMSICSFVFSQTRYKLKAGVKSEKSYKSKSDLRTKEMIAIPQTSNFLPKAGVDIVNIIHIGTSSNVYDFAANLTSVWTSEQLNTISFYHRMGGLLDSLGNAADFGYDISIDGGQTWGNMIRDFYSGELNGSLPNHGIYNPSGNENPDNAYIVYNLSGTDGNSSGYIHGISSIGDTSVRSQTFDNSTSYADVLPSAFDITQTGNVFIVDPIIDDAWEYQDSLLIIKGVWNSNLNDFDYSNSKLEAVVSGNILQPMDIKIAFGEDGQTGYICMIANNGMAQQQSGFTNLYPIYWKTIDGGETWDGPEFIQLDGPLGLDCIVHHHLTDQEIVELFGDNPPERVDISYTTAFDHDIAVDNNGELHIGVVIGPTGADPYSIITAEGFLAVYDFRHNGSVWCPSEMGRLFTFRGSFGDLKEDNRIRISKNKSGDFLFFSWLDTDLEGADENNRPNIWCRALDVSGWLKSENSIGGDGPTNVTVFSEGMWESYFGTASKYVIPQGDSFIVPYVFASFYNFDFSGEVQYKYISDFMPSWPNEWSYDDCPCGVVSTGVEIEDNKFRISRNMPNPFTTQTTFEVSLPQETHLLLQVYNVQSKLVDEIIYANLPQGNSKINYLPKSRAVELKPGLYIYKFTANAKSISGKMVVK